MLPLPVLLSSLAAVAVLGSWSTYMLAVPSGRVPVRPVGHVLVQTCAIGAAATGLGLLPASDASTAALAATVALSGLALTMGGLFLFLLTQRKTPVGNLRVSLGQSMLPFTARTRESAEFSSDSLRGQRVLLKFFRGHW